MSCAYHSLTVPEKGKYSVVQHLKLPPMTSTFHVSPGCFTCNPASCQSSWGSSSRLFKDLGPCHPWESSRWNSWLLFSTWSTLGLLTANKGSISNSNMACFLKKTNENVVTNWLHQAPFILDEPMVYLASYKLFCILIIFPDFRSQPTALGFVEYQIPKHRIPHNMELGDPLSKGVDPWHCIYCLWCILL